MTISSNKSKQYKKQGDSWNCKWTMNTLKKCSIIHQKEEISTTERQLSKGLGAGCRAHIYNYSGSGAEGGAWAQELDASWGHQETFVSEKKNLKKWLMKMLLTLDITKDIEQYNWWKHFKSFFNLLQNCTSVYHNPSVMKKCCMNKHEDG